MSSSAFPETYDEKIELYNNLKKAVNDPDIFWIPASPDNPLRFVTKQQLARIVREHLVSNWKYTHGSYDVMIQMLLIFQI